MKKLLILPLIILLSGCVTYYYPETALEDGVYYAEDDPKYVVYRDPYPGRALYPWVSMDYFYLGYSPFHRHPLFPYHYGFPLAFFYSDHLNWYDPYSQLTFYNGNRYYGYCRHFRVCGNQGNGNPRHGNDRYASNDLDDPGNHRDDEIDSNDLPEAYGDNQNSTAVITTMPHSRYVSTSPSSGPSWNRGLVIRSNESSKVGESHIQPNEASVVSNGIVIAGPTSQTPVQPTNTNSSGRSSSVTTTRPTASRSSRPPSSRSTSSSRPASGNSRRASSGSSSRRQSAPRTSRPALRKDKD